MIDVKVCSLHRRKSSIVQYEALVAQNTGLEPCIGGEDAHFEQHEHQPLVRAFENRLVCRASSCLNLIDLDEPVVKQQ